MIPELGRSPGEGNGNPLQCSCLENSMDRGAWLTTVHRAARVGHDLALSFFLSSPESEMSGDRGSAEMHNWPLRM